MGTVRIAPVATLAWALVAACGEAERGMPPSMGPAAPTTAEPNNPATMPSEPNTPQVTQPQMESPPAKMETPKSENEKPAAPSSMEKPQAESPKPTAPANDTTYTEHVRPILSRACVQCHSEGQIAPFSLDTYEQAKAFAPLIAEATRARVMPPSVIDNSGTCNTFRDIPWLTDDEIATIERWAKQDAPEGDSAVPAPVVPELPKLTGDIRTLATPSYVPSIAKNDDWRCFVVDSPFAESTFVTGYDTRPGDKKTAHHMVIFYPMDDVSAGLASVQDELEEGPGYTCFGSPGVPASVIAAWAPGGGATLYPTGLGVPVVANRPLIIQMHYNTADTPMPAADMTEIDLQVQSEGIQPGAFIQVLDLEMNLPPGRTDAEEIVQVSIADRMPEQTEPIEIYGIFPHMHELGKTLTLSVAREGSEPQCLLDAPRYDFHWQRLYFFDEPITVGPSDRLSARCVFDTTTRTTATVWGESTQDEMCVAGLFVKL